MNDVSGTDQISASAKSLKFSSLAGSLGFAVSAIWFLAGFLDGSPGKGTVLFGLLALLTALFAGLSYQAYKVARAGNIPNLRRLKLLTIFNLIVLGVPILLLGLFSLYYGFGVIFKYDLLTGGALLIFGCCAVLFFASHIAILKTAAKLKRLS